MAEVRYDGGLDKLVPLEDARDAHQAVGLWWARTLLEADSNRSVNSDRIINEEGAKLLTILMKASIGGFAEALGDLSRERDTHRIGVDLHPSREHIEATILAGMPDNDTYVIPRGNSTFVYEGTVYARTGYDVDAVQIWPPSEK